MKKFDIQKEMARHLVLDIETAGTEKGSMILTIGAVCGHQEFYMKISENVGTIDPATMEWWANQESKHAFNEAWTNRGVFSAKEVLGAFVQFIRESSAIYLWGNSPDFDFGHIEYWLNFYDIARPWEFYELRDIRTIKHFLTDEEIDDAIDPRLFKHVAIDDARQEALFLRAFLLKMNKINETKGQ